MSTTAVQEAWFSAAPGRSLNYDGHYGLQCVDAVDAYAEDIFGVPWEQCVGGVGGANQLLDVAPDAYWTRIDNNSYDPLQVPERGDVIVFAGDQYNKFGHTAVVLAATTDGMSLLQQDGFAAPLQYVDDNWYSNKPAHIAWLDYEQAGTGPVIGWLRPRPEKIRGYTPTVTVQSTTTITPAKPAPAAPTKGKFLADLTEAEQREILIKTRELHRDYIQGIPGVRADGDSFNLIRRIGQKFGVTVNEAARKAKYGKK